MLARPVPGLAGVFTGPLSTKLEDDPSKLRSIRFANDQQWPTSGCSFSQLPRRSIVVLKLIARSPLFTPEFVLCSCRDLLIRKVSTAMKDAKNLNFVGLNSVE